MSSIGMGAMEASGADFGQPYVESDILDAVANSKAAGVNLIDTAEEYGRGNSEKVVGKALKEAGRDNFVVATKVYGQHLRYEELQKACAASLERLGVNEIDLYQVHWPDPWEQIPFKYTFKALEKLYDEGKIRAIGVSNFAVRDLEEARSLLSHAEIVSNQVRYNLLQREIEEEVLPYCQKNSISILAWAPIASGALSGKYTIASPPSDHRKTYAVLFHPENLAQIEKVNKILGEIASSRRKTVSQVALNWLLSANPGVIPIPGARNGAQAAENAGAAGWSLNSQELRALRDETEKLKLNYFP
ncbi:MAG: aldo/keto reductase [Thaumarchaeota archaeon]|nr:aldo/keto reductase [Nitrososphaerota archaeon]